MRIGLGRTAASRFHGCTLFQSAGLSNSWFMDCDANFYREGARMCATDEPARLSLNHRHWRA